MRRSDRAPRVCSRIRSPSGSTMRTEPRTKSGPFGRGSTVVSAGCCSSRPPSSRRWWSAPVGQPRSQSRQRLRRRRRRRPRAAPLERTPGVAGPRSCARECRAAAPTEPQSQRRRTCVTDPALAPASASIRDLHVRHDEIGVVGVAANVRTHERAERNDAQPAGANVVERAGDQPRAKALALERRQNLGVDQHDVVRRQAVGDLTDDLLVEQSS